MDSYSYLATSWVFLSFNMVFVTMSAFHFFAAPPGYTVVGMLAAARNHLRGAGLAQSRDEVPVATATEPKARPTRYLTDKHNMSAIVMYVLSLVTLAM